ncbi:MAG: hypothetical protein KGH94_00800 [Candidatus Micrarchaeota archaeon]|nr:hypothetical protein [Candidatus Micrarchaeota archaeon]
MLPPSIPGVLYYLYSGSAVLIALGYMLFDVFNNREVPNLFAYLTLAFSFVVVLATANWNLALESYLVAVAILSLGYFVYKIGQLGLGDVFELAALSLLLAPISAPLLYPHGLAGLPPVVSLFLDTGIAAIVAVPLFYMALAARKMGARVFSEVNGRNVAKAAVIVISYLVFAALLAQIAHGKIGLFLVLLVIVLGSAMLLVFERPITEVMVDRVSVSGFVEEDMIAFNLMSSKEIASSKKRIRSFDRLVTKAMISEMKRKGITTKYPVYKRAIPFAVPIFLGTVLTILLGNILLALLIG